MPHRTRLLLLSAALAAAGLGLAGCGSSGGSDAAPTTEAATASSTTTTEAATTTTSTGGTSTTAAGPVDGPVDCEALLEEYATVFDPNDLAPAVAFYRKYEPAMPADVAAATERLAVAYEEAGDLGHMDLADVDLTADAQTFSDWTNDGCPTG